MAYQVEGSGAYMENHVSAQVLTGKGGLASFQAKEGNVVLLSVGDDSKLRVSLKQDDTSSSWGAVDLVPPTDGGLASKVLPLMVSDDEVMLHVVFADSSNKDHKLYVSQKLNTSSSSLWLLGKEAVTWTELRYHSSTSSGIDANYLVFAELLDGVDPNALRPSEAPALAVVVLRTSDGGSAVPFYVDWRKSEGAQWSEFKGQNTSVVDTPAYFRTAKMYDVNVRMVVKGMVRSYRSSGGQGDVTVAEFIPYYYQSGMDPAPITLSNKYMQNPKAVAVLPSLFRKEQSPIFVAASRGIYLVQVNESTRRVENHLVVPVSGDRTFDQLHAASNLNGDVTLFGTVPQAKNGHSVMSTTFRAKANTGTRAGSDAGQENDITDPANWSKALTIYKNVVEMTPLQGDHAMDAGMVVVHAAGMSNLDKSLNLNDQSQVVGHIWRQKIDRGAGKPASYEWRNEAMGSPKTDDCIVLKSFTTRLRVTDPDTGLPVQSNDPDGNNASVQLSANVPCQVYVNQKPYSFDGKTAPKVRLDNTGYLDIIHGTGGLRAVNWEVTPLGVSTDMGVVGGTASTIKPASDAVTKMQAAAKTDFAYEKYSDPGDPTKKISLVAHKGNVAAASTATTQLTGWIATGDKPKADTATDSGGLESSLLSDLGDLVQSVVHGIEDAVMAELKFVDDEVHLLVHFAEGAISAVIHTIDDALHALMAVIKQIVADVEAIFRWLALLFEWGKIKAVHASLRQFFLDMSNEVKKEIGGAIGHIKQEAKTSLGKMNAANATKAGATMKGFNSGRDAWSSKKQAQKKVGGADPQTSPKFGWASNHLKNVPSGSTTVIRSTATPFGGVMDDLLKDADTTITKIGDDFSGVWHGSVKPEDLLTDVANDLAAGVKSGFLDLVEGSANEIENLTDDALKAIDASIDIPVLTALYHKFVGPHFSVLDLSCLVQAVIIVIGVDLASDGEADPESATNAMVSSVMGQLTDVLNGNAVGVDSEGLIDLGDDASAIDYVVGSLTIAQAILQAVNLGYALYMAQLNKETYSETLAIVSRIPSVLLQTIGCIRAPSGSFQRHFGVVSLIITLVSSWVYFTVDDDERGKTGMVLSVISLVMAFVELMEDVGTGTGDVPTNDALTMIYQASDIVAGELVKRGKGLFVLVGLVIIARMAVLCVVGGRTLAGRK